MFFKNSKKFGFERTLPTERLHALFGEAVLRQLTEDKATYVKSKRSLRFEKDVFRYEVAWDQSRFNTRQNDTQFQMRCSLFSSPYRKWEKIFYGLPKALTTTPITGLSFHKIPGFDTSGYVHQGYSLNFKNRKTLSCAIAKNIDLHCRKFFSCFEFWDDKAVATLEQVGHPFFPQKIPLVITDFLILQNRIDEAWTYLNTHDQWYKAFIEQGENGGEGLKDLWGAPYFQRIDKLKTLLGH